MAFIRRHAFKIAILALCAAMAGYLLWEREASARLPVLKDAPDYELAALGGAKERLADSAGGVRVYYFFFSNCPDFCPTTTALMTDVQDELKAKGEFGKGGVTFHWITIDPERDTEAVMDKYASAYGVDREGWTFLRGGAKETVELAGKFGLLIQNAGGPDALVHQDRLILVDGKGRIRKYIPGSGDESKNAILADIELARKG